MHNLSFWADPFTCMLMISAGPSFQRSFETHPDRRMWPFRWILLHFTVHNKQCHSVSLFVTAWHHDCMTKQYVHTAVKWHILVLSELRLAAQLPIITMQLTVTGTGLSPAPRSASDLIHCSVPADSPQTVGGCGPKSSRPNSRGGIRGWVGGGGQLEANSHFSHSQDPAPSPTGDWHPLINGHEIQRPFDGLHTAVIQLLPASE